MKNRSTAKLNRTDVIFFSSCLPKFSSRRITLNLNKNVKIYRKNPNFFNKITNKVYGSGHYMHLLAKDIDIVC